MADHAQLVLLKRVYELEQQLIALKARVEILEAPPVYEITPRETPAEYGGVVFPPKRKPGRPRKVASGN